MLSFVADQAIRRAVLEERSALALELDSCIELINLHLTFAPVPTAQPTGDGTEPAGP